MFYINTKTLEYPITEYEIRQLYSNVSFPRNFVPPDEYSPVISTVQPVYDKLTQKVVEDIPEKINKKWTQVWKIVDLDEKEIEEIKQKIKKINKNIAESKLKETDWVELDDVTNQNNSIFLTNKKKFVDYRSKLRYIAVYPPDEIVVWPEKPKSEWGSR